MLTNLARKIEIHLSKQKYKSSKILTKTWSLASEFIVVKRIKKWMTTSFSKEKIFGSNSC